MSDIQAITYDDVQLVTPSDSRAQYSSPPAGFLVNVAGTVQLVTPAGSIVQLTCNAGVIYPIAFKWIKATGTSATGIYAMVASPYKAWANT
jgi:hypothetical protein